MQSYSGSEGCGRVAASVRRGRDGFTLIELVVTVAILSVLASAIVPLAELAATRSKEMELRAALRSIRTAIDAYKRAADEGRVQRAADESGYPRTLDVLAQGVPDARSTTRQRIYFLRRVPRDPLADAAEQDPVKTWGLRSYESPPDAPEPGKDVFDVYSRSDARGLNGVPYREW